MVNTIGFVVLVVWVIVAIPVGRVAYTKNADDSRHGKVVDILLAVGKGIIWPPYLLGLWLQKYIKSSY